MAAFDALPTNVSLLKLIIYLITLNTYRILPPLASCIEFVTGLWIRFYESGTEPSSQPYLSIPKKCLISKRHPSRREVLISNLLISSNSSVAHNNDECFFKTHQLLCVPSGSHPRLSISSRKFLRF